MEDSILKSTKKILGVSEDYTAFDLDIITHINSIFSIVNQLGIGPEESVVIEDAETNWADLELSGKQLSLLRTYLFIRVRMLFDPPTTSFHIEAVNKQIEEFEHRLSWAREELVPYPVVEEVEIV